MAQEAPHLPSLWERAEQSMLLAMCIKRLDIAYIAACSGNEECMQRYVRLLAQQDSLLMDIRALIEALEVEAEAYGTGEMAAAARLQCLAWHTWHLWYYRSSALHCPDLSDQRHMQRAWDSPAVPPEWASVCISRIQ
jgi:hypothetical protein